MLDRPRFFLILKHMLNYQAMDRTYQALGDRTRRALVERPRKRRATRRLNRNHFGPLPRSPPQPLRLLKRLPDPRRRRLNAPRHRHAHGHGPHRHERNRQLHGRRRSSEVGGRANACPTIFPSPKTVFLSDRSEAQGAEGPAVVLVDRSPTILRCFKSHFWDPGKSQNANVFNVAGLPTGLECNR